MGFVVIRFRVIRFVMVRFVVIRFVVVWFWVMFERMRLMMVGLVVIRFVVMRHVMIRIVVIRHIVGIMIGFWMVLQMWQGMVWFRMMVWVVWHVVRIVMRKGYWMRFRNRHMGLMKRHMRFG